MIHNSKYLFVRDTHITGDFDYEFLLCLHVTKKEELCREIDIAPCSIFNKCTDKIEKFGMKQWKSSELDRIQPNYRMEFSQTTERISAKLPNDFRPNYRMIKLIFVYLQPKTNNI